MPTFDNLHAAFDSNKFLNNKHTQIAGLDLEFTGSLVHVIADVPEAKFGFHHNTVEENVFMGLRTRLFEIDGGVSEIVGNTIRNNGYLGERLFTNHTDSMTEFYTKLNGSFPLKPYLVQEAQSNGVFGFVFTRHRVADG